METKNFNFDLMDVGQTQMMKTLADSPVQLSSFFAETCKLTIPHEYPFIIPNELSRYKNAVAFIEALGEVEHASDWDLGHKVTMMDGTIFYSEQGYTDLNFNKDFTILTIMVEDDRISIAESVDEDDGYNPPIKLDLEIKMIQSIELYN